VFSGNHPTAEPRAEKPSRLLSYRLAVKNLFLPGTKVKSEEFKTSNPVVDYTTLSQLLA